MLNNILLDISIYPAKEKPRFKTLELQNYPCRPTLVTSVLRNFARWYRNSYKGEGLGGVFIEVTSEDFMFVYRYRTPYQPLELLYQEGAL